MSDDTVEEWNPVHPDHITDPEIWEVINLFRGIDWQNEDAVKRRVEDLRDLSEYEDPPAAGLEGPS